MFVQAYAPPATAAKLASTTIGEIPDDADAVDPTPAPDKIGRMCASETGTSSLPRFWWAYSASL